MADINAKSSKSPLGTLYGDDAVRRIYWPRKFENKDEPDLSKIRFAVNLVPDEQGYKPRSIEVFAKNENGDWRPFVYVMRGDLAIPARYLLDNLFPNSAKHVTLIQISSASILYRTIKSQKKGRIGYRLFRILY